MSSLVFELNEQLPLALVSACLYLVSHIIRAIRLRFMISSESFRTKDTVFVQFGSASIGNLLIPFMKDLLALFLFWTTERRNTLKMLISLLYLRFFDFLTITPMLFIIVITGTKAKQGLAIILFILMTTVFLFLILLPKLCKLLMDYLIKYSHSKQALISLKFLSKLKELYAEMKLNDIGKAFLILISTIIIWLVELSGIWIFASQVFKADFITSYFYLLGNVLTNIPFIEEIQFPTNLYSVPYSLFLLVSVIYILMYVLNKKGIISIPKWLT